AKGPVRTQLGVTEQRELVLAALGHRLSALRLRLADGDDPGAGVGVVPKLDLEALPALLEAGAAEVAHEDDENRAVCPEVRQPARLAGRVGEERVGSGIADLWRQLFEPYAGRPH